MNRGTPEALVRGRRVMRKVLHNSVLIFILLVMWTSACEVKRREETGKLEKATITEKEWGNAPDFTLSDLEGKSLTLSEFRGKVIILNFWATWCPPCRREIPDFIDLYRNYKDKGLIILGINLDAGDIRSVKRFSEEYGINYPVVIGNDSVTQDYGGIRAIPTTFIIDKKGDIREKYVGYQPRATFEKAVKNLLEIT